MHSTRATNAILLVAVGFLGVIASHVAGTPLFGLAGFVAFVLAATIAVGALLGAIREGFNTPHEPHKNAPAEPVKRAPAEPAKRKRRPDPVTSDLY